MRVFIQTFEFEFIGLRLLGYIAVNREIYVPIEHICELLDLNFEAQFEHILNQGVIWDMLETFNRKDIPEYPTAQDYPWFLNIKAFPYWLMTLKPWSVKDEIRDSLVRFQIEAAKTIGFSMLLHMVRPNSGYNFSPN